MPLIHSLGLTLLLSLSTLTVNSAADDDGTWTYSLSGDEATVTGCVETCSSELVIPSTVDGYSVTSIFRNAFSNSLITSVIIPDSVRIISPGAFRGNQLTSVTIPESVWSLAGFSGNLLTSIAIPKGVLRIGRMAFADNQLTDILLAPSVIEIGEYAFFANRLKSITIPDSVLKLEYAAFYSNVLEDVHFSGGRPENLKESAGQSGSPFVGNPNLELITYCEIMNEGWPGDSFSNGTFQVSAIGQDCDSDDDGFADSLDAFPRNPSESADNDLDGLGNNYEVEEGLNPDDGDSDDDGLGDGEEVLLLGSDPLQWDTDQDGIADRADNCSLIVNEYQSDSDEDNVGDVCDEFPEDQRRSKLCRTESTSDLEFSSQKELDNFFNNNPTCDFVEQIAISTLNELVNIKNVDSMKAVRSIGGFRIYYPSPYVVSLQGLANVTEINRINIVGASRLRTLAGLDSLVRSGAILLADNPLLADLSGLQQLKLVGELYISRNPKLVSLQGLSGIKKMAMDTQFFDGSCCAGPYLYVESNPLLEDCSAIGGLLGAPVYPHDRSKDLIEEVSGREMNMPITVANNAVSASSIDSCIRQATDSDSDGFNDFLDVFPFDELEHLDSDLDGVGDNADVFFLDARESSDADGDGKGDNADLDDDNDGFTDDTDNCPGVINADQLDTDSDSVGDACDADDDNDGVLDADDAFPLDAGETSDSDNDGVGNNSDAFPDDATESVDSDSDSVGDNADNCSSLANSSQLNTDGDSEGDACDSDDDNDGFSDDQEELDGTNPKSRFSCTSGCFSFDVDENLEARPLTDGLLVIRHLFGFRGDSLTSGAVSGEASRDSSAAITGYLTDAEPELDIDGDGESKPLTDGLLLIRYLFGFSGDSLISGAIGDGAERDTAEEVEAYIRERVPAL